MVEILVKTSIMKLCTGFYHIIVFVHDNNISSSINGSNHIADLTQLFHTLTLIFRGNFFLQSKSWHSLNFTHPI